MSISGSDLEQRQQNASTAHSRRRHEIKIDYGGYAEEEPSTPSLEYTDDEDKPTRSRSYCQLLQQKRHIDAMKKKQTQQQEEIQAVYLELSAISDKLRKEYTVLHEREALMNTQEKKFSREKAMFDKLVELEVQRRIAIKLQEHTVEIEQQACLLRERTRDNKRLKENFETLKAVNDNLKKELDKVQTQHDTLTKQQASLQARLTNMQRLQMKSDRKMENTSVEASKQRLVTNTVKEAKQKSVKQYQGLYETLSVLLSWVSQIQLQYTLTEQPTRPLDHLLNAAVVQDRCVKALPSILDLLRDVILPVNTTPHQYDIILSSLQFVYWSLAHLDNAQAKQKVSLTSTLRRFGEELYRPRLVRFNDNDDDAVVSSVRGTQPASSTDNMSCDGSTGAGGGGGISSGGGGVAKQPAHFLRSSDIHVRLLSALIILRTLSQVDLVAHVLDTVRSDLKTEQGKQLFLQYQATNVLLIFVKVTNKLLLNAVIDCYLLLAMESRTLTVFLESCANEAWFRSCSAVMRMHNPDHTTLEKLSILMQKLSKIKSNKKLFDQFGLSTTTSDLLRSVGNSNEFLALNLRSILFNLRPNTQHNS